MQGTRRPDGTQPHEMEPGDYALSESGNVVWIRDPRGDIGHVNEKWTITVEDDETITVDPSIWSNKNGTPPGWHGFLQRGVWNEV